MDEYLAKSNPPESIRSHAERLLALLDQLMLCYPEALCEREYVLVRLAAKHHDDGKTAYLFQRETTEKAGLPFQRDPALDSLYRQYTSFPHGYLSPAFLPLDTLYGQLGADGLLALVNAIYFHHTRPRVAPGEEQRIIEGDLKPRLGERFALDTSYLSLVQGQGRPLKRPQWLLYAVVKGTLNRLDYAASALGAVLEEPRLQDGMSFGAFVEKKLTACFPLRPVQTYMKENRDKNLIVTASTGIGKTEAACLWAGEDKLFYTLPLRVSINAIYKRLHDTEDGGYGFENCAMLHADALNILLASETESGGAIEKYDKTRLFAYPVTVCTVDQLFTFVYRYLGCEIIPSVLKYSRVVVDEIQAYSPEIAAKIVVGLELICALGGRFAVITATMPPFLEDAMRRRGIPFEKPAPFYSPTPRHVLQYVKGDFDYAHIAALGQHGKVLVICNTVRRACEVYETLRDAAPSVRLLHARFKQRDRRRLEGDIMTFSKGGGAGVWVTTQIVEASLDIDFDYLFTEMCPADSLMQRLGRCRRRRSYTGPEPNVFVCDTGNGVGSIYDADICARSAALLPDYCDRVFTEEEKDTYVCAVYDTAALRLTGYYKRFIDTMQQVQNLPPALFTAEEAHGKFRDIESVSVIDDNDYDEMQNSGELDALAEAFRSKDRITRAGARLRLLDHTITINPNYAGKAGVDFHSPILSEIKNRSLPPVYRTAADYDFNEESGQGLGLRFEPGADTNFI